MANKSITSRNIQNVAAKLADGEIVAIPTETVYGLGADATNERAVKAIFAAKGRPAINPLISHVADMAMAENYAIFDNVAYDLAHTFWPGALTMVLPQKPSAIAPSVTAGLSTIAIRMPAHTIMHALIAELDKPIAAPSANKSGRMSPTTAAHVARDFNDIHILDGGACDHGLESTVVTIENGKVILLRHGAVPIEALVAHLGYTPATDSHSEKPRSPGQLLKHYAPRTKLVLNSLKGEIQLGFGTGGTLDLSPTGDTQEAAHNLFDMLQQLDEQAEKQGIVEIHIAPIPLNGLGAAINDRLSRAANSVE